MATARTTTQGADETAVGARAEIDAATRKLAIKAAYRDERIWDVLLYQSAAEAGPADGGCLVCAKAIIYAFGRGHLVRITSQANGGQTEHYGAKVEGLIYDFYGEHKTPASWIKKFAEMERSALQGRALTYAEGLDQKDISIVDDEGASRRIARLMTSKF